MLAETSTRVDLAAWYRAHDLPAGTEVIGEVKHYFLGANFRKLLE